MRGGIADKHTRNSWSTERSRSRFLFLMLVSAEMIDVFLERSSGSCIIR